MPQRLKNLRITKIALVPKGMNPEAHVLLYKSATEEETRMETVDKAVHDAKVSELEGLIASLRGDLETLKKAQPPSDEDLWKGVSPLLKAQFEAQNRRLKTAEEAVALEKAERERVVYIGKAASYKYLPIKADDDWEHLRNLYTLPAATQEFVERILKAAEENGRLAKLTTPHGRNGSGPDLPGGGKDRFEALLAERVAKGLAKTEEEALPVVAREYPELYRAYGRTIQREEKD
jgi:hypothetical protein